jgi:phasin protein
VSIDSLNQDLARLEEDVRKLARDSQRITVDIGQQAAQTAREEIVAAEFIATEETLENTGNVLETLATLRDIQQESLRTLIDDHRQSWQALADVRSPLDLVQLGFEHWRRRSSHIALELNQVVDLIATSSRQMTASMFQVWRPFVDLVRRDWQGQRSR